PQFYRRSGWTVGPIQRRRIVASPPVRTDRPDKPREDGPRRRVSRADPEPGSPIARTGARYLRAVSRADRARSRPPIVGRRRDAPCDGAPVYSNRGMGQGEGARLTVSRGFSRPGPPRLVDQ